MTFFNNLPITTKFVLSFLIIALVPMAIAIHISYDTSRKVLEAEVTNSLVAVADNKTSQIEFYLREKERAVTNLSHTSDIIEAMEKLSESFENKDVNPEVFQDIKKEYRPFLTYYKKTSEFEDLYLIRPRGEIVFAVNGLPISSIYEIALYEESELAKVFIQAKKSSKTEISDFEYDYNAEKAALYISAPILKGAELIGVLIVKMDNAGISELVQDYSSLGDTGGTMIMAHSGDNVVFATPLRFDKNAAFVRSVKKNSFEASSLRRRATSDRDVGRAIDYRQEEVLFVSRYIPSFRWGLIVKMDTKEVFSSANQLRKKLMNISIILMCAVVVIAIVIARTISRPIRALTDVSASIAEGNLSARAAVYAQDEIGELALAFNQMTDNLVEANKNIEQKRAELESQKGMLEKVNKELDSFTYTASHDLRAPLRGIASFAKFLEEDYKDTLDDEGRDHIQEIIGGVNRMNQLIDDLLALSRISRIQNPFEDVNINELLEAVLKRIEFDIKEHKVEMVIPPNIPVVCCDRIKMTEVFLNLINNGIKFSSKDNPDHPRVEVGYVSEVDHHKFFVKDNGIGIDPKYHDQIFGMFKRLHSNAEYEGTGAGLGIVKKVIEDHHGRIWIESVVGQGATFVFTIPKELKEKKKIGEILVEDGFVSQDVLNQELDKQKSQEV